MPWPRYPRSYPLADRRGGHKLSVLQQSPEHDAGEFFAELSDQFRLPGFRSQGQKKQRPLLEGQAAAPPPHREDKLTGVLPILGPGVRGVPLPKVAAHVTGVASLPKSPAAAESPRRSRGYSGERIRAWEGQRGLSFLQNMELKGGELLVPRAGLYYIYAQTYFRLPSAGETEGEETEDEGAELVQYIYKKMSSYTGPILLMKSSRSVCWPRGQEQGLFSLHQAGSAFLQPADRLFVTVSNASAMEMDGRASYFGAFLVD
ncbi:PREDICTED: tumor necrosis factor ligand superfamily member 10 isoform X3 [Cyprinodon variegatus]|uniref:tumor necrosis factor ligand superfamily member 10 isoform X3 n=1 Tax=Cyprinodon variegatus TaxID=28743 RepID=UPI0007426EFA|nr:PREDICTED: tumor necrosis factor ligand superfamily member 10 isoform X3 [Cyprinodon variegatus]